MEDKKVKYSLHDIYPNSRQHNLNYWERLQLVLDAANTRAQNIQLRKAWIERQNLTNYRNEYDRLFGSLQHLPPGLRKVAIQNMMGSDKFHALDEHSEEEEAEAKQRTRKQEKNRRRTERFKKMRTNKINL